MGRLADQIRAAVAGERVLVSVHADDRLRERGVPAWQVVAGLADGRLIRERPGDLPNPAAEFDQTLADGTAVKAVWAFVRGAGVALLVTVHFYDR